MTLHSTMFLLIPVPRFPEAHPHRTLHSTMFLLIQGFTGALDAIKQFFTFHYVSINTSKENIKSY